MDRIIIVIEANKAQNNCSCVNDVNKLNMTENLKLVNNV